MNGMGILKGLTVTLKHFFQTYVDDIRYGGRKYLGSENFETRQGLRAQGAYTVQYPDEKLAMPERFRFVPFLVVEEPDHPDRAGHDWCTSCGICAKVCPPQCIWIVRSEDPVTKRPVPEPEAFFIDIDICMNCGYCAEFCPFDAIKMDHDYEMADYDRTGVGNHIHDKQRLSKPFEYYYNISPTTATEEAAGRGGWEHPDVVKEKKKSGAPLMEKPWHILRDEDPELRAAKEAAAKAAAAAAAASTGAASIDLVAERAKRRAEALARHKASGV